MSLEWVDGQTQTVYFTLEPEADPLAVLHRATAAGRVVDFGLELPRLSQLFREAVLT